MTGFGARVLDVMPYGGVGALTALLLVLLLRIALPRGAGAGVRLPLTLVVVHVVAVLVRTAVPDASRAARPLELVALLSVLFAIGRSLFLLVARTSVGPKLTGPMPKIFWDIAQALIYAGVVLLALNEAGVEPGSLLTTSALLTAVVGLSLQDTLGNLFAGLSIQAQTPFEVGDWVQFDADQAHVGQVVEINWRATKVVTADEVEVIVPNATLAKAPIRNYTKPTTVSRRTIEVQCASDVPPRQVIDVLTRAVASVPGVLAAPAPSTVVRQFAESGVAYLVHYFIDNFGRRNAIDSSAREHVWYALKRHAIAIPFPTRELRVSAAAPAAAARPDDAEIDRRARALQGVDFLAALPGPALHALAAQTTEVLYAPGETVLRQGDAGDEFFVVERGELSVLVGRPGGSSAEVARLGAGKFFGEMSLMTGERRAATVEALSECNLLVFGKAAFQSVLKASPGLAERVTAVLAARQEQIDENVASREARARAAVEGDKGRLLLGRIRQFFALD